MFHMSARIGAASEGGTLYRVEILSSTDLLGGKDESLNLGALQLCLQVNHTDLSGRDCTVN